jgi:AcrR family transcriptional regulator
MLQPPLRDQLSRRDRKKRETRARILREARRLFADKGFEATTVDEISEAADVSRGTLFNYFQGKSSLLAEMADEMEERFEHLLERECRRKVSTQERLNGFFRYSAEAIERTRELTRALMRQARTRGEPSEQRDQMGRMHGALERLLRAGIDQGDVRDDLPLPFLVEMVAGAYNEVVLTWLIDPDYPLAERLRQAAVFIAEAMRSPSAPPHAKARESDR